MAYKNNSSFVDKNKKEKTKRPLVVYGKHTYKKSFFSCDQCNQSFTRENDCKAHKRRVHPLELTFFGQIAQRVTEGALPEEFNFFSILEQEFLMLLAQNK